MKNSKLLSTTCILLILLIFCLVDVVTPTQALTGASHSTSPYPPRPPLEALAQVSDVTAPSATLSLPGLKAVLLVGPIDGDNGPWTLDEIDNMELAADVLEANGVTVYRFYAGDGSTFADIEAAAEGAHFLLYRGHGVYDGNLPYPEVGGFYLSSGFYLSDRIRSNLHLAPNAIVMLYGCFTAGSSSAVGDTYDIGITEASRRVAQYSDPFFDIGAAGYYANWYGNAFARFLTNLFAGQTLGQAYENYFDFNPNTVFRTTHPNHPELAMWLDKDNWDYWQYNNAFAGKSAQTLASLFPTATLGGIPSSLSFDVNVSSDIAIEPPAYTITPLNLSGDLSIQWSVEASGDWFEVSTLHGTTPASSFTITPTTFDSSRPGEYSGTITVTAQAPVETLNPVQVIALHLQVYAPELGGLPEELHFVYSLPEGRLMTADYVVTPENTGSALPLALTFQSDAAWLVIEPSTGTTPQEFVVSPTGFDLLPPGVYTTSLAVEATTEAGTVYNSPLTIPVSLYVIDTSFFHNYLTAVYNH